ncbi:unnamed protein product [Staurois parvus]|uniref:Secreted protein n=1 Tax=Staurois parvus TaxID=386267 RepID=A0ABN9H0H8_9NEOB|nr:unnamed protein product [Staurois parvus]
MGPRTASSCCCQACNLPWAPVPPPHAAARSTVSHGSLCHFQVSSHCWCVPFCHRVWQITGLPLLLPRPVICHGPPYRLLMLHARSTVSMGPCCTASI